MDKRLFKKMGLGFWVLLFMVGFGLLFTSCIITRGAKPESTPSQAVSSQGLKGETGSEVQTDTEKSPPQKKSESGG